MNGLGAAAILHHRLAEQSATALAAAEAVASRLRAGASFVEELDRQAAEDGVEPEKDPLPKPPTPNAIGSAVCAAVASMENGDWAGPIQTSYGWELIYLAERVEGVRNRAPVSIYRIQFPVGSPTDRQQALADWSTLPLSGNTELLDCLSIEFRRNRTAPQTSQ
jgi:hypothetical protein